MSNHVHLLLTPDAADSCARLMKQLGQLHTQYVNRTYGRSGSLWEGRYRSCLVQSEEYLLACYRYIELNPVRAGLSLNPRQYPWSSYRVNAEAFRDPMITPHEEYLRLGSVETERKGAYRTLFGSSLDPKRFDEIRTATNGNFALGTKAFQQMVSAALGRRVERGTPGRPSQLPGQAAGQPDLLDALKKNVVCP